MSGPLRMPAKTGRVSPSSSQLPSGLFCEELKYDMATTSPSSADANASVSQAAARPGSFGSLRQPYSATSIGRSPAASRANSSLSPKGTHALPFVGDHGLYRSSP